MSKEFEEWMKKVDEGFTMIATTLKSHNESLIGLLARIRNLEETVKDLKKKPPS